MNVYDRPLDPKLSQQTSNLRALNNQRVDPGRPRNAQCPQSKLSTMIPRGRDLTGIKVKGRTP